MSANQYTSFRLISNDPAAATYAAERDGQHFLVYVQVDEGGEKLTEKPMTDYQALEQEALAILNADCEPEVDGVYIPRASADKYFQSITELEGLPGCMSGVRQEQKYILVPRHLIEYEQLEEEDYMPLLFAHIYPPEEEAEEMFALLREMIEG